MALKKLAKNYAESTEAMRSLRPHDLVHKTNLILVEDIFGFLPAMLTEKPLLAKGFLKELGFEINNENVVPEVSRVIRLPSGFSIGKISEEKKSTSTGRKFEDVSAKKRKRVYDGVIFVFNDGLTNAVKRKVKVAELL